MSLFEHIKSGILETRADAIAHHRGESLKAAGSWLYDQALGADIKTLTNRNASALDKVLAGISIASNFVGPEGKLFDKGLTFAAKEIFGRGGEKMLASGVEKLEVTIGKNAVKELAELAGSISKRVIKGVELAEKTIDSKATSEDFKAALHAKPRDRASAWAEVAKDLAAKRLDDARPSEKPMLIRLQDDATSTLLQDAEKFKGSNGRTFILGADLVIDVRTNKDFITATDATLRKMHVEAADAGKHLVVYAPNISAAQEQKLRVDGIFVAKTGRDLTELSVAAKVPGGLGIRLLDLEKQITGNEIAAGASAFAKSGPAEVGRFHENATEWDARDRHYGTISWARDGEVQQYDRGKWIHYRESQLEGDKPIEGHEVSIKADPAHPGVAIVSDALQHQQDVERSRAPETAPTR